MNSTAQKDFLAAMLKLYKEGEAIDANIVCQGIEKPVHSAVLVARCLIVVFVRFHDIPPRRDQYKVCTSNNAFIPYPQYPLSMMHK